MAERTFEMAAVTAVSAILRALSRALPSEVSATTGLENNIFSLSIDNAERTFS